MIVPSVSNINAVTQCFAFTFLANRKFRDLDDSHILIAYRIGFKRNEWSTSQNT